MNCPICGASARNISSPDFDGDSVRCSADCGEFDVAGSAMERLLRLDFNERLAALNKARQFRSRTDRPCISTSSL